MSKLKKSQGAELLRKGMPHSVNLLSNDEMGELFGGDCTNGFVCKKYCEVYCENKYSHPIT